MKKILYTLLSLLFLSRFVQAHALAGSIIGAGGLLISSVSAAFITLVLKIILNIIKKNFVFSLKNLSALWPIFFASFIALSILFNHLTYTPYKPH